MHYKQKGFTLLEILLVMLLLQYTLRQAVDKLTIQLQQISDKALIQGKTYGLSVNNGGYEIMQLVDNQWQVAADNKQPINEEINFTLRHSENKAIGSRNNILTATDSLKTDNVKKANNKNQQPNIMFWSDGTITPFEMQISYQTAKYRLSVNALGEVKMITEDNQ